MQGEEEKWVLEKSEINGSNHSDFGNRNVIVSGSSSVKPLMMVNSESFYKRLGEHFESSGLSLVFNARDTVVDLYLIYKQVTQRGGFHQVTRDKRWDEVASAVKLEGSNVKLVTQLQKLYLTLLIQFEQIYSYRDPEKPDKGPGDSSAMKRKYPKSFSFMFDIPDAPTGKVKRTDNSFSITRGFGSEEQNMFPLMPMPPEVKLVNNAPLPQGWRNPYQMFLKKECARLKSIHGSGVNRKNTRDMAIDAWNHLSHEDRQPYIELSRKDKERYWQEMRVYLDHKDSERNMASTGDYHVSLQPDAESFYLPDQPTVDFGTEMMKTAPPPSVESLSDVN